MSVRDIHLRKLLKFMYLDGSARISALRADIRDDIKRQRDRDGDDPRGGADFYGPFWRDAKDHVFGISDLRDATAERIASNAGRAKLYAQLRDGFLIWWDERRRWTNEPFRPAPALRVEYRPPSGDPNIKFTNILSVRDGRNEDHFVYPYWFPQPPLVDESARVALWLMSRAFPKIDPQELRVLDVIRGRTFSLDRNPFSGDEQRIFERRFEAIRQQWDQLRREYP